MIRISGIGPRNPWKASRALRTFCTEWLLEPICGDSISLRPYVIPDRRLVGRAKRTTRASEPVTVLQHLICAQSENAFTLFEYPVRFGCAKLRRTARHALPTWESVIMGLVDALVDRSFRDTPSGRIVVFSGDSRKRGYLVRSAVEEQKIRSFLKMFYFAHLYNLAFGIIVSQSFSSWITYESFERPAHHLLGSISIFIGIYALVVGIPYTFLWRAYKRGLRSYSAPADEVSLAGTNATGRQWIALAIAGFVVLIVGVILILAVRPQVP